MGTPEQLFGEGAGEQSIKEVLDPRHLYGAYVFDETNIRKSDIVTLMEQAQQLGYQVRFWWLSEVKELEGYPDFLIVGMHYPSAVEEAGLELHEAFRDNLIEKRVTWDDVVAVEVDEYRQFGKTVKRPESIFRPDGKPLFPELEVGTEAFFTLSEGDIQFVADGVLGRYLSINEMQAVIRELPRFHDWLGAIEATMKHCQRSGEVGPGAKESELLEAELAEPELSIHQLPYSSWTEDYENEQGRFGNVVRVYEGIDAEGQLYVRREWAIGEPPDDFRPHGWAWAYVPDSGDTLEQVLAGLDEMVAKGILTPEERTRSEAYYRQMFS